METIQTNALLSDRKLNIPLTGRIKEAILNHQGKIGVAAGLVAGTVFVSGRYFSPILETEPEPEAHVKPVTVEEISKNPGTYVSTNLDNRIIPTADHAENFEDAFAQQRTVQGPGGIFEYHGKTYNTFFKEEWESMSDHDKQSYYAGLNEKLDLDESKLLISNSDGNITTLSFGEEHIMTVEVIDEDHDGVIDIAAIDINFDGVADYSFNIESVEVHPDTHIDVTDHHIIIDDNSINPVWETEYHQVDHDDISIVPDHHDPTMQDQNIFHDDAISNIDLPDMVDDIDMNEFNEL